MRSPGSTGLRASTDTGSRRTIASFDDYVDAQRAVDRLSDEGFPVERVTIVGTGLRYVEQVTGRMTTGRATLTGPALLLLVLYGLAAGALAGALLGAITHAATGGMRDFASVAGMQADRYEVVVDDDVADRAASILRSM